MIRKVFLSGQRTFSNRGCEAIVRSTVNVLRSLYGNLEVIVPSNDIERDGRQWPEASECGVRFTPAYFPFYTKYWIHLQRLPVSFLKGAGWPFPFPQWFREMIASVDLVLSVGGDNYSLDYRLPSLLQGIDGLAVKMGVPVVLWGASVGPFEREPGFVPAIRGHLSGLDRILVREGESYAYLTGALGLDNVERMVDPAFALEPSAVDVSGFMPEDGGNGIVGLNVSPVIERYKKPDQDLLDEVERFVRYLVKESAHGVLLLPHVIPLDGAGRNNDAEYMGTIVDNCADLGKAVAMAPPCLNAPQLKYLVSRLRFFIGARTHATIAALSSGIPTVSIAYSVKARGINRDIFGHEDLVLPTPELCAEELQRSFSYLCDHEDSLKRLLGEKMLSYTMLVEKAAKDLEELLNR